MRACLDRIEQLQGQRQGLRAAEYDVWNAPADLNEPAFETVRQTIGPHTREILDESSPSRASAKFGQ